MALVILNHSPRSGGTCEYLPVNLKVAIVLVCPQYMKVLVWRRVKDRCNGAFLVARQECG